MRAEPDVPLRYPLSGRGVRHPELQRQVRRQRVQRRLRQQPVAVRAEHSGGVLVAKLRELSLGLPHARSMAVGAQLHGALPEQLQVMHAAHGISCRNSAEGRLAAWHAAVRTSTARLKGRVLDPLQRRLGLLIHEALLQLQRSTRHIAPREDDLDSTVAAAIDRRAHHIHGAWRRTRHPRSNSSRVEPCAPIAVQALELRFQRVQVVLVALHVSQDQDDGLVDHIRAEALHVGAPPPLADDVGAGPAHPAPP